MGRRQSLFYLILEKCVDYVIIMTDQFSDKRKFSGNRVIGRCEVIIKKDDPFATWNNVKTGHMVLNIRGGCLYLGEYFDEQNIVKFFPDNGSGKFIKLTLSADNRPDVVLENIKVAFLRLRKEANREGIVFRFVDITDTQLDILDNLRFNLPTIGPSEEASVPFDEIISLDRSHNFELLE